MNYVNPYEKCPVLETEMFLLRLVEESDAENLLMCYSDKESLKIFNSDNCPIDFYFDYKDELHKLIKFWLWEYSEGGYVRSSIVDKSLNTAIGTIEIFAKKETFDDYGKVGVLRLDLSSTYEKAESLDNILGLVLNHFGELFKINSIISKANTYAIARKEIISNLDFYPLENKYITSYDDYYIRKL